MPAGLVVGKTVAIEPVSVTVSGQPVAKTITYVTTTKTEKTETVPAN